MGGGGGGYRGGHLLYFSSSTPRVSPLAERPLVTLGLGPLSGVSISRLSGVDALWDCVPRVCGGRGGCAGGGLPLGAVFALSWYGEVSLGGKHIIG